MSAYELAEALRRAEIAVIVHARSWAGKCQYTRRADRARSLERAIAALNRLQLASDGKAVTIDPLDVSCPASACRGIIGVRCTGPHHGDCERRTEDGFIDWTGWHLDEPHEERRALAARLSVHETKTPSREGVSGGGAS